MSGSRGVIGGGEPTRPVVLQRADPKIQIVGPSLFVRENVAVGHEADVVHLEVGGERLTFHYAFAIQLSALLRVHAKHAKTLAGDGRRHWSVYATLTDAEEDYKYGRG